MGPRNSRVCEQIKMLAATFLERESDRTSMITVTGATVSKDFKNATVFFTVYPEEKEDVALKFVKRQRSGFRDYVKTHAAMKRIPFFDFAIDMGEKNRQRIDELSQNL